MRGVRRRSVLVRLALACAAVACTHRTSLDTRTTASTSPAGQWEGVLHSPGSAARPLTITLDTTPNGWSGTLLAPWLNREPIAFTSVVHGGDSLALQLPAAGQSAAFHGRFSVDRHHLVGRVGDVSTFDVARTGTPDAAALAAEVQRAETSRRLAAALIDTVSQAAPNENPDSARLVTSDIALFWAALDDAAQAPPDSLGSFLQRDYLDRASIGVHDFIPGRIQSAEDLAAYVRDHRAQYDSVRAANLDVRQVDAPIRAAFRKLKTLYSAAVFPDVYFVIGRSNSGGTSSRHGLLIGAEKYPDQSRLPSIVSHELIHYQQHCDAPTLLEHSFIEGSADFVGEMISGTQINGPAHAYGLAHEHELWQEFTPHVADRELYPWMYGTPPDGRPNDLGYFIGYRIAQAYYDKTADKRQALRDIITACGDGVKEILAKSGYNP
jgi:predicted Zn-dependent protease DUF2268